ncbi:Uncharacterized protein dnm_086410 [Desulfonema magnum]|uniref:Uncharacterized protein n=1 Tax=Desulfonema magnum TaxID=45655 RepID=A0A975BVT3_9BACT|nr:Uncharacterized protein dnm_086410 [Desulfonema magnum]
MASYKYLTISFRYLPGEETRLFLPEGSAACYGKSRVSPLFAKKKIYKETFDRVLIWMHRPIA